MPDPLHVRLSEKSLHAVFGMHWSHDHMLFVSVANVHLQEKMKRDAGQQSRGKSTVEEEKRIARQFGVYSGFD